MGQSFTVRVVFYDVVDIVMQRASVPSCSTTPRRSRCLTGTPYGVAGDYATTWFGPDGCAGLRPTSPPTALRLTPSSGRSTAALGTTFWPRGLNPIDFGTAFVDGKHTIAHYGVAADRCSPTAQSPSASSAGTRSLPTWNFSSGPNSTTWYGNAPIPWAATIADDTPAQAWLRRRASPTRPARTAHVRRSSTALRSRGRPYRYQASRRRPGRRSTLAVTAVDMVGNGAAPSPVTIKWDLVAPHTSYTIDPAGADTISGWTNKDVTVTFHAMDGAPTAELRCCLHRVHRGQCHLDRACVQRVGHQAHSGLRWHVFDDRHRRRLPSAPASSGSARSTRPHPANKEVWQAGHGLHRQERPAALRRRSELVDQRSQRTSASTMTRQRSEQRPPAPPGIEYRVTGLARINPPIWTQGIGPSVSRWTISATSLTASITSMYRATD